MTAETFAGWRNERNATAGATHRRRRRGRQVRGDGRRVVGPGRQVQAAAHARTPAGSTTSSTRSPPSSAATPRRRAPSPACASSTSAAAAACSPSRWRGSAPRWWASTPPPATSRSPSLHAAQSGLAIDYRHGTAEDLAAAGEAFDVVLNMEVVEHVADPPAYLAACRDLLGPAG